MAKTSCAWLLPADGRSRIFRRYNLSSMSAATDAISRVGNSQIMALKFSILMVICFDGQPESILIVLKVELTVYNIHI